MSAADTKAAGPPVPVPPDPQATGKSSSHDDAPRVQKRKRKKGELLPYLLILPAIVAIAAVYLYPLGKTVIMSFQDMGRRELWSGEPAPWVGLEQFTNILGDSEFWWVTFRTVVFMVICVTLTMGLGLLVALLMRKLSTWVRLVLTACLIAAWSMPLMVAASIFRFMADSDYGLINTLIAKVVGEDWLGHNWYLDPIQGFGIITLLVVWGAIPFVVVTLYAALTQVPQELEEAAALDGASAYGIYKFVTWPVIKPVFTMVATLSVIWDFNVFGQIWLLRGNKPEPEYETLGLYSYSKAFESTSFSQGTAIALITVLLLSGVAVYYLRQLMKTGEVE
ncbi:sugar ABC transporter permease [Streptomyces anulatus]|uniref:carbohydrate ABC transporter permease n=1 Tax=Streptomyces TaxID=1883 RepID=UPI00067BCDB4|nr:MULTISPECIES: sugar ABC transporter permease [Streptomyces]KND29560.1 sugar ABC transporter permease [Streptomyces europaeiscabiei]MDF9806574.1 N,N'-diacetylchitobiose transport system permease protein [Streptomyces sp. HB372]KPL32465.1 sugar ABC transporter permease [Streptomyces anulatus]KQX35976.1 sugar ABC transporter permease [Streptomyces sp. Root1295]KRA39841.1 sugar ABC transporter permease [Streptomyces sp. Root63]